VDQPKKAERGYLTRSNLYTFPHLLGTKKVSLSVFIEQHIVFTECFDDVTISSCQLGFPPTRLLRLRHFLNPGSPDSKLSLNHSSESSSPFPNTTAFLNYAILNAGTSRSVVLLPNFFGGCDYELGTGIWRPRSPMFLNVPTLLPFPRALF